MPYTILFDAYKKRKHQYDKKDPVYTEAFLKAPTRIELVIEVLQTFALPLGHGAL